MWFIISFKSITLHLVSVFFCVLISRLLPSSLISGRERSAQHRSVVRSQTTYPVVAHVRQLDPVTIPLSWNDKTGRNHQNLHVVVDLADGPLKGVVQIENVVEHLWDNVGLVDRSVDDGGRVLSHVHEREETSVFQLLFEQLVELDQVV